MAEDPFASASFFHLVIIAILRHLLGIKSFDRDHSLTRHTGILGRIEGYIGTVEAQGRGNLHLHMVLWLTGSVPAPQMKDYLLSEHFRANLKTFISTNIRVHILDVTGEAILSVSKHSAIAFSCPVDPQESDYKLKSLCAEKTLARTLQIHQCNRGCMKLVNGHWLCKRHTPFPLADEAWVDETGQWGPKRCYRYFNNFCPPLLQSV